MDLQQWLAALADELGVADVGLDEEAVSTLLDLTRDAAHQVERVAGPLTTFVLGVAVGRGADLGVAAEVAATRLERAATDPDKPGAD